MITDKDIKEMAEYIEKVLNENPKLLPKWRVVYLSICNQSKYRTLSEKQKDVLVIGYNKIFDRVERNNKDC
jgi:hypothetical protein